MIIVELYVRGRITKLRALETLRAFLTKVEDAEKVPLRSADSHAVFMS